jgi:hypothetical protein
VAQYYGMTWWSLPYGTQVTCGVDEGIPFTQRHFYEWSGEKPEWIFIFVTGPRTYDEDSQLFVSHYKVTNIFPNDWEWETDYNDYREHWIYGRLKNEYWNDATKRTDTPIGYDIELHRLESGTYTTDHHLAGYYGFDPPEQENGGTSRYNANDCVWFPVHLPLILKED